MKGTLGAAVALTAMAFAVLFWTWLFIRGILWLWEHHPFLLVGMVLFVLAGALWQTK